jgi:hypothetical protein
MSDVSILGMFDDFPIYIRTLCFTKYVVGVGAYAFSPLTMPFSYSIFHLHFFFSRLIVPQACGTCFLINFYCFYILFIYFTGNSFPTFTSLRAYRSNRDLVIPLKEGYDIMCDDEQRSSPRDYTSRIY